MKLPDSLLAKYTARFDSLIAEGQSIKNNVKEVPATMRQNVMGDSVERFPAYKQLDLGKFIEWRTKVATLLASIVPKGHIHRDEVEKLPTLQASPDSLHTAVSLLKGIKDDWDQGFFDDLPLAIEAEVAADYMGQAENLLAEGQQGKFDHVPAAVLAGAVLEKALRTMCGQQQPPVSIVNTNGEPKKLNLVIDDLKKAGAFSETKAKQLRAWAGIRNHAAHGEFDQFTRADVDAMIPGINTFLADYLK
jgi:hypothetical protein